ncbi:MAG: aminopeptidase P family protein [Nitrososphaerota archaeon]|nr:aminopeptidase P family protein [Nitrososphaerota archaeon]
MGRMDSPAGRRRVLADKLSRSGLKFAIVSNPKHIFYLTGISSNLNPYYVLGKGQRSIAFLAVGDEGQSSLLLGGSEFWSPWAREDVSGPRPDPASMNGVGLSLYSDYGLDTTMVPYGAEIAPEVKFWLRRLARAEGWLSARRVGVEDWHLPGVHREVIQRTVNRGRLVGISQTIMDMRKTKGRDELENLRAAAKALDYAYGFAKAVAEEGRTELDMFRAMNDAAFARFGVFGMIGGDVVSGKRNLEVGGMATRRKFRRGETVIIDMQTTHNNYWSDTARTFVIGRPTRGQQKALETVIEAKDMAARMLKPGTPTADIANEVNSFLKKRGYSEMPHHIGHTVGLDDQERPWLIRGSTDVVRENQAYVIEPGVYEKGTGGVRVEDCYFVTRGGREKVSTFPLGF